MNKNPIFISLNNNITNVKFVILTKVLAVNPRLMSNITFIPFNFHKQQLKRCFLYMVKEKEMLYWKCECGIWNSASICEECGMEHTKFLEITTKEIRERMEV